MRIIALLLLCGTLASCASVSDVASPAELGNDVDEAAIRATVFEMIRIGSEWKVQFLMWQEESPADPVPAAFLPKQ